MLAGLAADCALGLYASAGRAAAPLLRWHLRRRAARGLEDPSRLGERLGRASRGRPEGPLVWIHGASVGEVLSALPLMEHIAAERPGITQLVTSATLSSARVLAGRLPAGAVHQFAPLDLPGAVDRFLSHWRPGLALFMESELWPTLLDRTRRSGANLVLVNARMSPRSYRAWRRFPALAARLLNGFSTVLAQSPQDQQRFRALGAEQAHYLGNLKFGATPLAADPAVLAELRAALGGRPCWLAASTHPGEEDIAAEVHEALLTRHPELLTMIVPRHPERGPSIAQRLASRGHSVARRSLNQAPDAKTDVFLGDTIGELGLFYRLSEIAFIGGSLTAKGGQNPIEPAKLDCAILCGPNHGNFEQIVTEMADCGAMELVHGSAELGDKLGMLLESRDQWAAMGRSASRYVGAREGVLQDTLEVLSPNLDRLAPGRGHAESLAAKARTGRLQNQPRQA